MRTLAGFLLLAMLTTSGCLGADAAPTLSGISCDPGPMESGERREAVDSLGTIRFQQIEGGFFGIVLDDGRQLDPMNLCEEMKQDGERVHVVGFVRNGMAGIHMWGSSFEITTIEPA